MSEIISNLLIFDSLMTAFGTCRVCIVHATYTKGLCTSEKNHKLPKNSFFCTEFTHISVLFNVKITPIMNKTLMPVSDRRKSCMFLLYAARTILFRNNNNTTNGMNKSNDEKINLVKYHDTLA